MDSSAFQGGRSSEAMWQSHVNYNMESTAVFKVKINNRVTTGSIELL